MSVIETLQERKTKTPSESKVEWFKAVQKGDLVVIEAKVTYVGNTSLEVRVDVYKEDVEKGKRYSVNRAFFTEVCIDDHGRPTRIPYALRIETLSEQADYEGAKKRIACRKERMKEGF